jgi:hypothetical protein
LNYYKNDNKIGLITGTNILSRWRSNRSGCFLSKYGGATMGCRTGWRRGWKLFDNDMKQWNDQKIREKLEKGIGKRHLEAMTDWYNECCCSGQTHI